MSGSRPEHLEENDDEEAGGTKEGSREQCKEQEQAGAEEYDEEEPEHQRCDEDVAREGQRIQEGTGP